MLTHRVFYSDNGTLTDYSLEAKEGSFTFTAVAAEDYLYIGQSFPFNSLYFDITTANTNASVLTIEYWEGDAWEEAVDLIDGTKSSGKTLGQSGIVRFTPDRETQWEIVRDTTENHTPTELQSIEIYNKYWIRLKFSADLTAVTVARITYKFCEDEDMDNLDPDISKYQASWESGKSDWVDQTVMASRHVVMDLKRRHLIFSAAQILSINEELNLLTAYRGLSVIYNGLGGKFIEQRDAALLQYKELLDSIKPVIDVNNNAIIDRGEYSMTHGKTIR